MDHRRYNGAAMLGLRGLVFKSHGTADAYAFEHALNRAYDAARHRLLDRVQDRIAAAVSSLPATGVESVDNSQGTVAASAPQTPVGRVA